MKKADAGGFSYPVREGLLVFLSFLFLPARAWANPAAFDTLALLFIPAFALETIVITLLLARRGFRWLPLLLLWPLITALTFVFGIAVINALNSTEFWTDNSIVNIAVFEGMTVLIEALILFALSRWTWMAPGKDRLPGPGRVLAASFLGNLASFLFYAVAMKLL